MPNTGVIGQFRITTETSVAAGIRRIEAITSAKADEYVRENLDLLDEIKLLLGGPKNTIQAVNNLLTENENLKKTISDIQDQEASRVKSELRNKVASKDGMNIIIDKVSLPNGGAAKDIAYQLKGEIDNLVLILATEVEGKPGITVMIDDDLVKEKGLNASKMVRDLAVNISGGGGGQPFFAQAGGKDVSGLDKVVEAANQLF